VKLLSPVDKAVAVVVRCRCGRPEILVFRHPLAGVQLPKGTVEIGENIAQATLRELAEESGLVLTVAPVPIGRWRRVIEGPPVQIQHWHIGLLTAPPELPDHWSHQASGSEQEEGLIFFYFWVGLDDDSSRFVHPLFADTLILIRSYFIKHDYYKPDKL